MLINRGVVLSIDEAIPLVVLISSVITLSGIYLKIGKPESKFHIVLFLVGIAGFIVSIWLCSIPYQSIRSVLKIFSL